ncbi:unnamed protein product, partial [marine sediment metagenome]
MINGGPGGIDQALGANLTMRSENLPKAVVLITAHAWVHENIGGSFKVATELAQYLASQGHRVFYVCGTREAEPVNPTRAGGVELWRYPFPKSRSPHPANVLGHVLGTRRLTRQIL